MFPSGRIGRTIEGFGQAVWDLRSLLAWLRARGAPMAGVAGMSLGGYTAALAATVEPRLDYGILIIPLGDLTDVAVEHDALRGKLIPPWLAEAGKRALTLVRPLAREPLVPGDRMLIAAAEADRITLSATHARKLAQHFRAPLVTFNGAHLIQIGRRTAFAGMAKLLARRGAIRGR
jgi:pimeloyl-ACP methyl ester carboxylesterase